MKEKLKISLLICVIVASGLFSIKNTQNLDKLVLNEAASYYSPFLYRFIPNYYNSQKTFYNSSDNTTYTNTGTVNDSYVNNTEALTDKEVNSSSRNNTEILTNKEVSVDCVYPAKELDKIEADKTSIHWQIAKLQGELNQAKKDYNSSKSKEPIRIQSYLPKSNGIMIEKMSKIRALMVELENLDKKEKELLDKYQKCLEGQD